MSPKTLIYAHEPLENQGFRPVNGYTNTILFTEAYGTCGLGGGNPNVVGQVYGTLWDDAQPNWRPGFAFLYGSHKSVVATGYPPAGLFQVQPNFDTSCNLDLPNSPHTGGINVGLGDGSVRFVAQGISATTWALACNPQDGLPMPADW